MKVIQSFSRSGLSFVFGLFIIIFYLIQPLYSQTIIIDHNCTDINLIPTSWINAAKNTLRCSYGHTSHGSQLITGMTALMNDPGSGNLYNFNTTGAVVAGVLSIADGTPAGDLGNPDRIEWEARTRSYLDGSGSDRNVVMWSWCGQVSSASAADINTYLTLMNGLEQDYPDVTFVYMTGHLDGTGVGGNLHVRNNQIRAWCQANNKILFDFADIESYDPDGNYFLDLGADDDCGYSGGNWADEWIAANPDSELAQLAAACGTCAHSRRLNCILKGSATWWLMARIAGWNGGSSIQPKVTVQSPNGGEDWLVGSSHVITWSTTGTVGNVSIHYSINNGSSWSTVISSTANDGSYSWTVPNTPSTQCLVRVREADGSPSDTSNAVFSISQPTPTPTITLISPNGGEQWLVGSSHKIKWESSGTVGPVTLRYSTTNGSDWTTIISSTANDGSYTWTVPAVVSSQCLIRIYEASDGNPADVSDAPFSIIQPLIPELCLSRETFNFGYAIGGKIPNCQWLRVCNCGDGTLDWTAVADAGWLSIEPTSGTGTGILALMIEPTGLAPGNYTGTITITDPNAANSPLTVTVNLKVKEAAQDQPPLGSFDTPQHNAVVCSSIPVTGWALDDVEMDSVKIYREENGKLIYIGDAVFVEGARPDIENSYPDYPCNYKAGWGYMMLTNSLPNQGNGTFVITTIATDSSGHQVTLGSRTIFGDNANAEKPFGALDTPGQGAKASGSQFINWGWVLTPQPNKIPTNGSTIHVYVDGVNLGSPIYNIYRSDIAALFPAYANSNGAAGYFYLDTTSYENGVHTIQWTAVDNGGNADGIGSRYFTIENSGNKQKESGNNTNNLFHLPVSQIPSEHFEPICIKKDCQPNLKPQILYPDDNGNITIEIKELQRIEIDLKGVGANPVDFPQKEWLGRLIIGNQLRPLPIGSSLDSKNGIFCWHPGPAFLGKFYFVFIERAPAGDFKKRQVEIVIQPGF